MPLVVGVRFNPATKVYYFDPAGLTDLLVGENVLVETARGEEVGKVIIAPHPVGDDQIVGRLKAVLMRASALDLTQMAYYRYREQAAQERCSQKIQEHNLSMKVVRAEYNYNGRRLVIFFTAEKRVDFRKLVQDLARTFKARIELRQIGVRDEAKLMGGIGKCGRALCCSTWLTEFSPVSIKMAKQQDLPLSPMEISGICGRLLCCLSYEKEFYTEIRKRLPRAGEIVDTPRGRGKVVQVNPIKESVQIELDSQVAIEVTQEELESGFEDAVQPLTPPPRPTSPRRRRRRGRRKS